MSSTWRQGFLGRGLMSLLSPFSTHSSVAASQRVYYPRPESRHDPRVDYPLKLLALALEQAGGQYQPYPSELSMQQGRAMQDVQAGSGLVHIVWSMTSQEREDMALPIRIPIYKGLIGWRLPLLTRQRVDQFSSVKSLADLLPFTAGQGHDWPDTGILRGNGLSVHGAPVYEGLFQSLAADQFHYFPRSVVEIWPEAQEHASAGLLVDPHIALHYPAAFYYFVNKNNLELASLVTLGLERALADGSFDRLFLHHFAPIIQRSNLSRRTVIELTNPLLPALTPLARKDLWFNPQSL